MGKKNGAHRLLETDDVNFAAPRYNERFSKIASGLKINQARPNDAGKEKTDCSKRLSHYVTGADDRAAGKVLTGCNVQAP